MKKIFNQLKVILSLTVVLTLLLGCGVLTYREAEQVIIDFRYKDSALTDLYADIRDYFNYGEKPGDDIFSANYNPDAKKGIGILPAFYLSHKDNHCDSVNVGFCCMLQDGKGEITEYQQSYILFEKNINDKSKEDVRVLILGDEFENTFPFSGKSENDNIEACRTLCGVEEYGEKTTSWDNIGDCLKVDGTCNEDMVYLRKLTWCDTIFTHTYTYSPQESQVHEGSVEFENWLDYKNNDVGIYVPHDVWYRAKSKPGYDLEAKEVCEQNLNLFKDGKAIMNGNDENMFKTISQTTAVIHDVDSDDYYIFTAAYVIHPLKTAVQFLTPVYLIALVIGVGLIVFINILLSKKKRILESSYILKEKITLAKED